MRQIHVATDKPYEVVVGRNLQAEIVQSIPNTVNRLCIIYAPIMKNYAEQLASEVSVLHPEMFCNFVAAPDSESAKSFDFVESTWNVLGDLKFTRSDLIISIGGGATTDVAGFIAATWLRGIEVIHVPTTLLGMVDAAVGGKTGINTFSGKNLVGAFHHPLSVWCDLDTLTTLPKDDLRAGFAEIVKCGFISDGKILELVQVNGESILELDNPALPEVIERAISVKAGVVARDFKENQVGGLGREVLNYGHTLGHAIEKLEKYTWRHGDAISVGMMFAVQLSFKVGLCSADLVLEQKRIIETLGLPTSYSGDFEALKDVMAIDKKSRGNTLRFVGLTNFGEVQIITAPSMADLGWAYEQITGGKK
jgi:3-dehydroquinate synthase